MEWQFFSAKKSQKDVCVSLFIVLWWTGNCNLGRLIFTNRIFQDWDRQGEILNDSLIQNLNPSSNPNPNPEPELMIPEPWTLHPNQG